jgi:hypothetical protein
MPARKIKPPRKRAAPKAQVVKFESRLQRGTDFAWGSYCLWPRHIISVITLPVVRVERYR